MEARVDYISTSCGRTPTALDCGPENHVAFGAKNALGLIYLPDDGRTKIINTFAGHTDRINSVRWARCALGGFDDRIITGSTDNTAIIWKKESDSFTFTKWHQLTGHSGAVNAVDALNGDVLHAATASVDSTVKIWKISKNNERTVQTLTLGSGLCLTLQLFTLPKTNAHILACGFDDNNIHLFGEVIHNQYEYVKLQVLIGHEDWVRGLDSINIEDDKILLASCSQDTYVRLWSINLYKEGKSTDKIQIEKKKMSIGDTTWTVSLDTVLSGHENAVYGVNWSLQSKGSGLKLLSASIDKSLIIWEQDKENKDGVWVESVRVGEVGGGGLGFYGGKFSQNGCKIIGHGYLGSLHIWNYISTSGRWEPGIPCGGHFEEVVNLAWEPKGEFLITASLDKTTRIHAPWVRDSGIITWHEIARPQVHGYEMSSLAVVSRYKFASGAEEKVIRTFKAPHNFIENFHSICKVAPDNLDDVNSLPEGASVPSLGLSNKAVYINDTKEVDINEKSVNKQYTENRFIPTKLEAPPTEETLMQNTLWPEQQKLYGHGHEVFAMAASSDERLLASACKATKPHHAAILIWDTNTWVQVQSLRSHTLTVTQLKFSPDNLCLLSVSRDRRWSIFRKESIKSDFILDATTDKTNGVHSRIIWCCDWTHDSKYFATGSRDGKVVVWTRGDEDSWKNFSPITPILNLPEQSVTALAFAPMLINGKYLMVIGFENGLLKVYSLNISSDGCHWSLQLELDNNLAHHLTVKAVAFRPVLGQAGSENNPKKLQFASSSSDNATKVFTLNI